MNEKEQGKKFPKALFFTPQYFGKRTHLESNTTVYKLDPKQLHHYQQVQKKNDMIFTYVEKESHCICLN